jgi:DNA-binding transcriptional LysR family regulator
MLCKAVELKSLTAAAKVPKLPKSNISRKIPLTRTTRASHLAEAGRALLRESGAGVERAGRCEGNAMRHS